LKQSRASTAGSFARNWRSTVWWLDCEIVTGWPSRGQLIAAGAWVSWLLFLCVHNTGEGKSYVFVFEIIRCLAKPMCYRNLALFWVSNALTFPPNFRYRGLVVTFWF
jgi:hypothetical protein